MMKNSKAIRVQFGLSQNEMATYLKINRSQLTMYEQGKRDLPTHALVKLAEMELFLVDYQAQRPKKSLPFETEQLQEAEVIVAEHQRELAYQQKVLQKKLATVQAKYKHNHHLLAFVAEQELKKNNAETNEKSWIEMMKTIAEQKIKANGLQHQAKIKLQLQRSQPQDQVDFLNHLKSNWLK